MSEFIINNDILTTFVYLQSTSGQFKYFTGAVKFVRPLGLRSTPLICKPCGCV